MVLKGPSIEDQSQLVNTADTSASASNAISQLLVFKGVEQPQLLVSDSSSTVTTDSSSTAYRKCYTQRHRKLCIHTVNTDVVILAITMFNQINPNELWLAFGTKAHFRYIPIYEVFNEIDPMVIKTLSVFHGFTGCDTVSVFGGRGRRQFGSHGKYFLMHGKYFLMQAKLLKIFF